MLLSPEAHAVFSEAQVVTVSPKFFTESNPLNKLYAVTEDLVPQRSPCPKLPLLYSIPAATHVSQTTTNSSSCCDQSNAGFCILPHSSSLPCNRLEEKLLSSSLPYLVFTHPRRHTTSSIHLGKRSTAAPRRVVAKLSKLAKLTKVSQSPTTFLKVRKIFLRSRFLTISCKNKGKFRKFLKVSLTL